MKRNERNYENDDIDRLSTVGRNLEASQLYSIEHPEYKFFQDAVEERLKQAVEREVSRQASARPLIVTSALTSEEVAALARLYPELRLVVVPMNNPVQSYWSTSRKCANEWMAAALDKYTTSVVHYGGAVSAAVVQTRKDWHVEYDASDAVMVNDEYADAVDMHRLYGDFARVQKDYGLVLPRSPYDEYLRGGSYVACTRPHLCTHKAEALCVDLSVTPLSPEQVALSMLQHGAELCYGFFPYSPNMLVQDKGVVGESGVVFEKKRNTLRFSYPEARVGVSMYALDVWTRWLASHTFRVAGNKWFQLELLKNRDAFMFFRMTVVPKPVGVVTVKHALDLTPQDEYEVVQSWKLKDGFASDPDNPDSWQRHSFVVRSRVIRRVFEFAMQLSQLNFSRFAIKKQIRVVNDRFVVHGTNVNVMPPLDPLVVEDLATAIYSKAFALRYESSQLSSEMMQSLKSLAAFHSSSMADKALIVARSLVRATAGGLYERIDGMVRDVVDMIGTYVSTRGLSAKADVSFTPAPTYVSFESHSNEWRTWFRETGERMFRDREALTTSSVVPTSMAGSLAMVLAKYSVSRDDLKDGLMNVVHMVASIEDTSEVRRRDDATDAMVAQVGKLNPMDRVAARQAYMKFEKPIERSLLTVAQFEGAHDPDPVHSLNVAYQSVMPGVASQSLEYDTFSLSLDPQDRTMAAPYLRMPQYFGVAPRPREYYRSKLMALNVPKRQNTSQELLSAITARNTSAPSIAVPQEDTMIQEIWDNFLNTMCTDDARAKLLEYQSSPVGLAEESLREWAAKAKPEVVERVKRELEDHSQALADKPVSEYLVMLKGDVKPTLSEKPVFEKTAPQVIVYHEKALSALYSSMFRVLVRRFLSLLKGNIFVNLLKNSQAMSERITAVHPFEETGLQFLENDFSKYDKSQSEFAFRLEYFVFQQLGLNQEFLDQWLEGHVECSLRSVACGLSLHVMYQRKSGDATTAFGNVILNVLSVAYAYQGTVIVWALFMGDDSLICARAVNTKGEPVKVLEEVFNLTGKYYITESPYFASNFVAIDSINSVVQLIPDPIKRIEKLSMHIAADDPQWSERHVSFCDSMAAYRDAWAIQHLSRLVPIRYEVSEGLVRGAASALGTLTADFDKFRALWHDKPELIAG